MKNLFDYVLVKRHHLVCNEEDVMRSLKAIQKHTRYVPDMAVGNCGWADTKKWFINFNTTENQWNQIVRDLQVVRVWGSCDIPNDTIGVIYTDD